MSEESFSSLNCSLNHKDKTMLLSCSYRSQWSRAILCSVEQNWGDGGDGGPKYEKHIKFCTVAICENAIMCYWLLSS